MPLFKSTTIVVKRRENAGDGLSDTDGKPRKLGAQEGRPDMAAVLKDLSKVKLKQVIRRYVDYDYPTPPLAH
jgi:hypothetical protein